MQSEIRNFGSYALEKLIGEGGFSEVHLAHAEHLPNVRVAVKVPKNPEDENQRKRLWLEAEALNALGEHPNIVGIRDYQPNDGHPYVVLDYCDSSLSSILGPLDWKHAVEFTKQILQGLEVVHANRKVRYHGDLKPSNILLKTEGGELVVKIADFGAQTGKREYSNSTTHLGSVVRDEDGSTLTLAYHAPEQINGGRVTSATDIHQAGQLLYEMISGANFRATEGRESPSKHGAPKWLDDVVFDATNPNPRSRPNVEDLISRLNQGLEGKFDGPTFLQRVGKGIRNLVDPAVSFGKGAFDLGKNTVKYATSPIWGPFWMIKEGWSGGDGLLLGGLAILAAELIGGYNTYETVQEKRMLNEARQVFSNSDQSFIYMNGNEVVTMPLDKMFDDKPEAYKRSMPVTPSKIIGVEANKLYCLTDNAYGNDVFSFDLNTGEAIRLFDAFGKKQSSISDAGIVNGQVAAEIGGQWYRLNSGTFELLGNKPEDISYGLSHQISNSDLEFDPWDGAQASVELQRVGAFWGDKSMAGKIDNFNGSNFGVVNYKPRPTQ